MDICAPETAVMSFWASSGRIGRVLWLPVAEPRELLGYEYEIFSTSLYIHLSAVIPGPPVVHHTCVISSLELSRILNCFYFAWVCCLCTTAYTSSLLSSRVTVQPSPSQGGARFNGLNRLHVCVFSPLGCGCDAVSPH